MKTENGEAKKTDNNTKKINNNNNNNNSCDSEIELEPFIHQVGGRSTILVLGKYICKPINERELDFYQTIDQYASSLKPFVAEYNGIISVNFEETNDGYLVITTTKSHLQTSCESNNKNENNINKNLNGGADKISTIDSSDSPYQKFVTKYRIKLVRPIKEIIIESHEHDVDSFIVDGNEKPQSPTRVNNNNQQYKHYILNDNKESNNRIDRNNSNNNHHNSNTQQSTTATTSTNLNRSRSTSISIPNFEDGNLNQSDLSSLFDNQLFINEVGHYGCRPMETAAADQQKNRKISSPASIHTPTILSVADTSSPTSPRNPFYNLSTTKHNPWVLKTFSVLSEFNESMKEQKNLTSNFEYPCIMDLKMGTRLHDDMATQTKIQSHESKVNETTSGVLGLRVTGIQIYDKNLDKFICYNKYYGRKLTPETFRSTLKMFVSNDNFKQHQLLEKMIERLRKLRSVIVELDGFRFYTSSLLLIYEGNTCHCNQSKSNENTNNNNNSDNQKKNNGEVVHLCELCNQDPDKLFDVRVIDFAHSIHSHSSIIKSGENNSIIAHKGYDEGFVFGLDNLIKILTLFLKESE